MKASNKIVLSFYDLPLGNVPSFRAEIDANQEEGFAAVPILFGVAFFLDLLNRGFSTLIAGILVTKTLKF